MVAANGTAGSSAGLLRHATGVVGVDFFFDDAQPGIAWPRWQTARSSLRRTPCLARGTRGDRSPVQPAIALRSRVGRTTRPRGQLASIPAVRAGAPACRIVVSRAPERVAAGTPRMERNGPCNSCPAAFLVHSQQGPDAFRPWWRLYVATTASWPPIGVELPSRTRCGAGGGQHSARRAEPASRPDHQQLANCRRSLAATRSHTRSCGVGERSVGGQGHGRGGARSGCARRGRAVTAARGCIPRGDLRPRHNGQDHDTARRRQ